MFVLRSQRTTPRWPSVSECIVARSVTVWVWDAMRTRRDAVLAYPGLIAYEDFADFNRTSSVLAVRGLSVVEDGALSTRDALLLSSLFVTIAGVCAFYYTSKTVPAGRHVIAILAKPDLEAKNASEKRLKDEVLLEPEHEVGYRKAMVEKDAISLSRVETVLDTQSERPCPTVPTQTNDVITARGQHSKDGTVNKLALSVVSITIDIPPSLQTDDAIDHLSDLLKNW